jgi:AcrR family transcriptional regulator
MHPVSSDLKTTLRADARANRAALVTAAAKLYAERGVEVPLEDVARLAGVGRATLYRHFPTRDALTAAIIEQFVLQFEHVAAASPRGPQSLFAMLRAVLGIRAANLPLIERLPSRHEWPPEAAPMSRRVEAALAGHLEAAREAGVVRPDVTVKDVRTLVEMLAAAAGPRVPREEQRRAWKLARAAIGARPEG